MIGFFLRMRFFGHIIRIIESSNHRIIESSEMLQKRDLDKTSLGLRFKSLLASSIPYLFLAFFFLEAIAALGQINRWDLLDQIAMLDNYIYNGSLYPDPNSSQPTGASVYFPGIALILLFLSRIGVASIPVELLLVLACLILCAFVLIQKLVMERLASQRIEWNYYVPAIIIFTTVVTPSYLFYGREFKPDTIALLTGYVSLFIAFPNKEYPKRTPWWRIVLGGTLCGLAIVFKQQYLAFLLGVVAFNAWSRVPKRVVFAITVLAWLCICISFLLSIQHLRFWTIKVIADDGFLPLRDILSLNSTTLFRFALFIAVFGLLSLRNISSLSLKKTLSQLPKIISKDFTWAILPSALAAFASAIKVGGNAGNTQLGLFLLAPFILLIFRNISIWKLACLAWVSILFAASQSIDAVFNYRAAVEYRDNAIELIKRSNANAISGSDVYFASRLSKSGGKIVNYWTLQLKDTTKSFADNLKSAIDNSPELPSLIFSENFPGNKEVITSHDHYDIVFENRIGIIAEYKNAQH